MRVQVGGERRLVHEAPVRQVEVAAVAPLRLGDLARDPEPALAERVARRQREAPVARRQVLVDERVDRDAADDAVRAEGDVEAAARAGRGERRLEAAAVEAVDRGLRDSRLARVRDLQRDLRPVVVAELDRAKRNQAVAAHRVVALSAPLRDVRDEEQVPVVALALLEDGGDRVLEREPRARHEAHHGDVGRKALDGADPFDERLEDAVVVEVDLLDAREPGEADVRVLVPAEALLGHGALALRRRNALGATGVGTAVGAGAAFADDAAGAAAAFAKDGDGLRA
jgi:hypothetical protein